MLGRFIKKERNRNHRGLLLLQIHVVDSTQYISTTLSRWPAPGHNYFILLLLKEKKVHYLQKNSDVKIRKFYFGRLILVLGFLRFGQFSDKIFGHCHKKLKKFELFIEICKMNESLSTKDDKS